MRRIEASTASALTMSLLGGADTFVGFMEAYAKRDTGRYVRAWIEAGNELGLPVRQLPPLRAGKWEEKIKGALEAQIERMVNRINSINGMLDSWYRKRGRKRDTFYRRKVREVNRITKRLARAVVQYRKFLGATGPVIAFDVFSQGRTKITKRGVRRMLRLTTVREKIYGGRGAVLERGDGEIVVVLHNREPHATLVEWRYRFVARAKGMVRVYTDTKARRVFLRGLDISSA